MSVSVLVPHPHQPEVLVTLRQLQEEMDASQALELQPRKVCWGHQVPEPWEPSNPRKVLVPREPGQ